MTQPDTTNTDVIKFADAAERFMDALTDLGRHGRALLLDAIADAIDDAAQLLAETAHEETQLGLTRTRSETARTAKQFRLMADVLRDPSAMPTMVDIGRDAADPRGPSPSLRREFEPLGVVAVFAASNFPLAFGVIGTDTAAALAAGCPVVAKAHSLQPRTATVCAEILHSVLVDRGLPLELFSIAFGRDAGRTLVQAPAVRAVAFTGSTGGGRALWNLAHSRPDPIPFFGELGGVNPVVITPSAAAERGHALGVDIAQAILLGGGQFCTKPGLIFVPSDPRGDGFRMSAAKTVAGAPAITMLGTGLADSYRLGAEKFLARPDIDQIAAGAGTQGDRETQALLLEIDGADAATVPDLVSEEVFGPFGLVISYANEVELLDVLRNIKGCLTVSIHDHPDDLHLTDELYRLARRRAGRILGGGVPTGVAVERAQHHGGPWPATTSPHHTSVGGESLARFVRPVVYQDVNPALVGNP